MSLPNANADSATTRTVDLADIKRQSVRGGTVTMLSQGLGVVIQLASTVVLARLLSPDDYGIIAMVVAATSFAGLFRDLGLSAASVQKGTLDHAQMSNLFWLNTGMGTILTLLLACSSPLVGWFYAKPEIVPLTLLLSTTFLIGSLGTQHGALLQRELRFGSRALASIVGSLVTLGVSIVLAIRGGGYWALAWGNIAGAITTTLFLFGLSSFRPSLWKRGAGVRSMLKFGANITAFDFVNYFHRNLDNLLIGRFWGPDALGLYSRAYALLMFPIANLRGPINGVAFPAMSRLQKEPDAFRAYYRRITCMLAMVSMPLAAYLFVASKPIVELTLGAEWAGVSPLFAILAITGFIQPVAGLRGMVLMSTGQGKRYLHWGIFNAVCTSIGFLCGVHWGASGIAVSYAIVNYAILYPSLRLAFKDTPVAVRDFFGPILLPAAGSMIAAAVSHLASPALGPVSPLYLALLLFTVFATTYLAFICALPAGRREIRQFAGMFSQFRSRAA